MPPTANAAEAPLPAADRPNPVRPSAKTISTKSLTAGRDASRPGKAPETRRAAAIKAMERVQNAVEGKPARSARTPSSNSTTAGSSTASAVVQAALAGTEVEEEPGTAIDAPLAADVLEDETPEQRRARRVEARKASAQRMKDFEAKKAARRAEYEKLQAEAGHKRELEAREAALKDRLAEVELLAKDPLGVLEKRGVTPTKIVGMALEETDPKLLAEAQLRRELDTIRKRLEEDDKARDSWRKQQDEREFVAKVEAFEKPFLELPKQEPKKFAILRRYAPDYVQQRCRTIAQSIIKESGKWPGSGQDAPCSQADILLYVQDQLFHEEEALAAAADAPADKGARREGPKVAATLAGSLSARTSSQGARRISREERKDRAKALIRLGR
jgi:hypothetical protein